MNVQKKSTAISKGQAGCHITYHTCASGEGLLFVSHYTSGSLSTFSVNANGVIDQLTQTIHFDFHSKATERQEKSHVHSIFVDMSTKKFAFVVDLGGDRVYQFIIDEGSKTLKENPQSPFLQLKYGGGPRHMVFHPSYKFAYVFNELNVTIDICKYDSTNGTLTFLEEISSLPEGFKGSASGSAIRISQDGSALFVANRFHDTIGVFLVNSETGKLSCIQHQETFGKTPRDFIIDQTGNWLLVANQDSDSIVTFKIDPNSKKLSKVSEINVISPTCLLEM